MKDTRRLSDMKEVIYDKKSLRQAEDRDLYYMNRGAFKSQAHKNAAEQAGVRFDITEILPGNIGPEFNKTKGHYHALVPGTNLTYPEMYQVIEGKATYILQKKLMNTIFDVMIIEAKSGDIVVIPPGYGHVTVNPGKQTLKMSNWISTGFESEYGEYVKNRGGAYYKLNDYRLEPNKHYGSLPRPRLIKNPDFRSLFAVDDMYELVEDISSLRFLNRPQDYDLLFRFSRIK